MITIDRYRVISQQNRGKIKTQTVADNKPKTAPLSYKSPVNLTPSLPVTQSYQPPYYNDPAVYSSDYDPHISQYAGEQLVSRGASTKPSPPPTSTFHELHGSSGYMRSKDSSDMYSSHNMVTKYDAYKDTNPAIFTTMPGSYGNSEVSNIVYNTVVFTVVVISYIINNNSNLLIVYQL